MNTIATITVSLRRITAQDNAAIAGVIRQVSAEYGLTADKGYTVADPNLMSFSSSTASRVPHTGWWSRMVRSSAAAA